MLREGGTLDIVHSMEGMGQSERGGCFEVIARVAS